MIPEEGSMVGKDALRSADILLYCGNKEHWMEYKVEQDRKGNAHLEYFMLLDAP